MVIGYFGLPRCGKSTFLACIAQQALASGKYEKIFCNYYIKGTYKLDPDNLGKYDFSKSLVLIDEITNIFDSRDFKKFKNYQREFWLLHGHFEMDIIYCTQVYDRVDKTIRDITEVLYHLRKFSVFTYAKCIHRILDVNNETKEIVYGYQIYKGLFGLLMAFFPGEFQLIFRPRWYKYFDTHERVKLPKKDFYLWEDVIAAQDILGEIEEPPTLLEQINNCISLYLDDNSDSSFNDALLDLPDSSGLPELDQVLITIQLRFLCQDNNCIELFNPILISLNIINKLPEDSAC